MWIIIVYSKFILLVQELAINLFVWAIVWTWIFFILLHTAFWLVCWSTRDFNHHFCETDLGPLFHNCKFSIIFIQYLVPYIETEALEMSAINSKGIPVWATNFVEYRKPIFAENVFFFLPTHSHDRNPLLFESTTLYFLLLSWRLLTLKSLSIRGLILFSPMAWLVQFFRHNVL